MDGQIPETGFEILERKGVHGKAKGHVISLLQESSIHHSFSFSFVSEVVKVLIGFAPSTLLTK